MASASARRAATADGWLGVGVTDDEPAYAGRQVNLPRHTWRRWATKELAPDRGRWHHRRPSRRPPLRRHAAGVTIRQRQERPCAEARTRRGEIAPRPTPSRAPPLIDPTWPLELLAASRRRCARIPRASTTSNAMLDVDARRRRRGDAAARRACPTRALEPRLASTLPARASRSCSRATAAAHRDLDRQSQRHRRAALARAGVHRLRHRPRRGRPLGRLGAAQLAGVAAAALGPRQARGSRRPRLLGRRHAGHAEGERGDEEAAGRAASAARRGSRASRGRSRGARSA